MGSRSISPVAAATITTLNSSGCSDVAIHATAADSGPDHLSRRNFQRLAAFIEGYSGIKMPPTKVTMIEGRLRRRLRATGMADLKQYCDFLFEKDGLATEAIHLIDVMTTNKTEFFREPDHFRFLSEQAVPRLLTTAKAGRTALKVWSAACSTGAEPYTLAMVLAELAQQNSGLHYGITATDISTEVLDVAISGIYPEAMVAPVPPELRRRYVLRSKERSRRLVRMTPELRATVRFARINLMEVPYQVERDMDVIFCRNILIYFDKETQQAVLQHLTEHLRPGGFLFLGHSETLAGFHLPVDPVGPTVFRRR
jgi:chemotaxis protein methyltransferase CheR